MKKLLYSTLSVFLLFIACSKEEQAPPPPPTPTYTLSFSAEAGGSVSSEGGTYNEGSKITVTATPDAQYLFKEWSDGSTANPREITVTSNLTLKASFIKKTYPLSVTIEGEGTVQEEVIIQGSNSETEYNAGTTVRLTATPNEGWVFAGWSGDVESDALEIEVPIEKGMSVTALFQLTNNTVTVKIIGAGKVNNMSEDFTMQIDQGQKISLNADPLNDWNLFLTWDGDINSTRKEIELVSDSDLELIAIFLSKEELSNVGINGEGEVKFSDFEIDPEDEDRVTSFNIEAIPSEGYVFRGWNGISTLFYGGVELTANPYRLELNKRLQSSPLVSYFVPDDGNYVQVRTLFQLIDYPLDQGINEILEGTAGAAAGAAYFENETGRYIIFMPNYPNNIVDTKDGLPRMGATIYRYEEDGWRFFKLDKGLQAWAIRNTEIIDNKYIISGDGNEIGSNPQDWNGDLFFGEINGESINWTRVTNNEEMTFFHGSGGGDLNGDGLIDLGGIGGNGFKIFLQTEPGVFTLSNDLLDFPNGIWDESLGFGSIPFALDFGDIDNDGSDEIIMADYGGGMNPSVENNISIWDYNPNTSKFEVSFFGLIPSTTHSMKRGATKISTEDFDNDGYRDVLVVGEGDQMTLEVWKNKGDNTFELNWFYAWNPNDFLIREYFLADANDDGFLDILPNTQNIGDRIILEGGYPYAKRLFNPQILINQGDATFKEYTNKQVIDYYSSFGGFSIPYSNNGLLEIMSIMATPEKVYPERNEVYIKTEVITIDLNE